MAAKSFIFGHLVYYYNGWKYADTNKPVESEIRNCPRCGRMPTNEGQDPCIANTSDITAACCGHGVEPGYIKK